jgi:Family of unknown function (DUF6221)
VSADLAAFLAARYQEAEALANAATPGKWLALDGGVQSAEDRSQWPVSETESSRYPADQAYIAANDPAHRLADVKLKRAILAEYETAVATMDRQIAERLGPGPTSGDVYLVADPAVLAEVSVLSIVVRQLGTEFAEHAGYRPEWAQ